MPTPPPRRRRDAIEKAALIERAATALVLDHGYDAVTVDMICERAGVSQRTFFNHFATKDAALLGTEPPAIDEPAARAFVTSSGPLLAEAAQLIPVDAGDLVSDPAELSRRIRAIGSSPLLMARQMERIESKAAELREIILLRLRTQFPDEPDADLQAQAGLITHLVAGLMRHIGQSWAEQAASGRVPDIDPSAIRALLSRVITKLG
jgi:AcrR family transcriptional regulator